MNIFEAKALGLERLYEMKRELESGADFDRALHRTITNAISELEFERGLKAEIEAKAEEKLGEEITFNIPGVDFSGLDADVIQLTQMLVMYDRKKLIEQHKQEIIALHEQAKEAERAAEEREIQLQRQNAELQRELLAKEHALRDVRFELETMTESRDNAARIIDELKEEIRQKDAEIVRLKAEIEQLKETKETVANAEPAPEVEEIQQLVNKIRYKAAEDWGSVVKVTLEDGETKLVKRSELAEMEPTEDANIPKAILPVIEVPQFRLPETDSDDAANVEQNDSKEVAFQTPAVDGLAQEHADVPVADGTDPGVVTRAEFEELKKRVIRLEKVANLPEAV